MRGCERVCDMKGCVRGCIIGEGVLSGCVMRSVCYERVCCVFKGVVCIERVCSVQCV